MYFDNGYVFPQPWEGTYKVLYSYDVTVPQYTGWECGTPPTSTLVGGYEPVKLEGGVLPLCGLHLDTGACNDFATYQLNGEDYLSILNVEHAVETYCPLYYKVESQSPNTAYDAIDDNWFVWDESGLVSKPVCALRRRLEEETEKSPEPDAEEVWWHRLETSRRSGEWYPRRILPGAQGRSAASSVALSITLAHPKRSVAVGQRATLDAMCDYLGECEYGDYWTSIHNRDDADNITAPHAPFSDSDWALVLLSMAIEPAVHEMVEGMLVCTASDLCNSNCDVCNEWVGLGNSTAELVLRSVESGLGVSKKGSSRSVLECVSSPTCLAEVATEVAVSVGAETALPVTVRLETVASANKELFESARMEFAQNASWQLRELERSKLIKAHGTLLRTHVPSPISETTEGRRMSEEAYVVPLSAIQQLMHTQTNKTCYMLSIKNASAAHKSHAVSTGIWMHMGGGGNDAKNRGRICRDCQFPNQTTSCRAHFAMVGRNFAKLRLQSEKESSDESARRLNLMKDHAKLHLGKVCCVRLASGAEECGVQHCVRHAHRTMKKRAMHVARELTIQEHPSALEHFGVATQLGIDIINPDLHHDPSCRGNQTDNRMECMGRSILHHLSARHGLSYDNAMEKLDQLGVNLGETLTTIARATGKLREKTGPVRSAFQQQRAKEVAQAEAIMEASRRRTERSEEGRRLGERRHLVGQALGKHAAHAGSMRRQLHNASSVMQNGMMRIDRAAIRSNNRLLSHDVHKKQRYTPRPEELGWHTLKESITGPLTTILAISSEEGSYASRFGGAVVELNKLRDRTAKAVASNRRRLEKREDPRRRLSINAQHASALYKALEDSHAARRLSEGPSPPLLELPASHSLSWIHEVVDWDATFTEGSRLYTITRARLKMRESGATHHEIVKAHPTGYKTLDDAARSQPSILGDAFRRLLYRKETNADPPWHGPGVTHRVNRRMSEEMGDAGRGGSIRRLGVAFFESTVAAPFAFYDTLLASGATVKESEISFWEATLRYIVSSTVGCYFVAPVNDVSSTQGDEPEGGDKLTILRPSEEKLCFPAVSYTTPTLLPYYRG